MTSDFEPQPERSQTTSDDWRREVVWGPREIIIGLVLGVVALLCIEVVAVIVARLLGVDVKNTTHADQVALVASVPFELMLFVIALSLTVGSRGAKLRSLGFRPLPLNLVWVTPAAVVGALSILLVYEGIANAIGGSRLLPQSNLKGDVLNQTAFVVMASVLALVLAPLVEETFFRGFLFGGLTRRFSFVIAALMSGFLFALAHGEPTVFIPFTFVGMVFAASYAYTGSLWTTISAHFLFNLISFIATLANR
ncbi:MAG: CPBP family intramembrane glutamic endopeptidase [Dehalococcoidia bacterium]|jgi:membrane protease YdiL (CAAX protease family)